MTGSRNLLEFNGIRLLVDCGLYQERKFRGRNWAPFPVPPPTIDGVLLTHAHVDHCGLIPRLVHEGFQGRIYCTPATAEIAKIILLDAAKLQEEDAEFKKKRHMREGRRGPFPEVPLYTVADAEACLPLFSPVAYGQPLPLDSAIEATFEDAGHVLGSSMIKVKVRRNGRETSIIFSGDVGRWDRPILHDPSVFHRADYVVIESTYGDRVNEGSEDIGDKLADIVNAACKVGGNIIIPSFALQRTQEVLYYLNDLLLDGRIPQLPVYLDSPMAIGITEVYKRHSELFDRDMTALLHHGRSPFDFPGLRMVATVEESKALNNTPGPLMIIAGSGMCTGGRIKHHLVTNITKPQNTVLFVGYQATGTLGRQITDGAPRVRILGAEYPVRARIEQIHGFSAHADRDGLLRWISGLVSAPRRVFVNHGEAEAAARFSKFLREKTGWNVSVPRYGSRVTLE